MVNTQNRSPHRGSLGGLASGIHRGQRLLLGLRDEVVNAPMLPILHASPWRLRWLGIFTLVGHPLFAWIWGHWLAQPYENVSLRILVASMGLLLIAPAVSNTPASRTTGAIFVAIFWLQLPLFFSWMYLCNGGNTVWLATVGSMLLIYYHVTDWRIATVGTFTGGGLAWLLFTAWGPTPLNLTADQVAVNAVVIAFCWASALLLGVSSANMRREHLRNTMTTMGIMAHELRTPLATISLLGDAVRAESYTLKGEPAQRLDRLAGRLQQLVRNMNRQIDFQIANARLMQLPEHTEEVSAAVLVRKAIAEHPFRTSKERECVQLQVWNDFEFMGSPTLFVQVFDNLIKNALRSLAATGMPPQPGDLRIEIGARQALGRIAIRDRGLGIAGPLQPLIFEPFFSTNSGTGHGLGLTFCRRVVQSAEGTIRVQSELGHGATFVIELPATVSGNRPLAPTDPHLSLP